jgi:hypothetical protein
MVVERSGRVEVWTWKLAKMLTMQGQQAVFPYPAGWRKCCANSPFPAAWPPFGWWEGPLWIRPRRGLAAYEICLSASYSMINAPHRGQKYIFTISGHDSFPSPLTRHIETWETSSDIFCTTQEHRRLYGNGRDVAPAGITTRFSLSSGYWVGLIDSEEEGDLDFGLECCGEIWSLEYLLCVIGHLVHRAVRPEWRYSNVSRVCTGKATHDAK